MLPALVPALACPLCRAALSLDARTLRCAAGHAFDVARSGYVSFLVGRSAGIGDSPAMVAARGRILDAGHFDPLSAALAAAARRIGDGIAVEVGAGTARHLARILDALPGALGLALDVSAAAARRAAHAHPRAAAIVADARRPFPIASAVARLALVAFAPRNGPELRRILRDDGALVVATPHPEHLTELRRALGLLDVDPQKAARLAASLSPWFSPEEAGGARWTMRLTRGECESLAAMGPSAHHAGAAELAERARALPAVMDVTGACAVEIWRPRPAPVSCSSPEVS